MIYNKNRPNFNTCLLIFYKATCKNLTDMYMNLTGLCMENIFNVRYTYVFTRYIVLLTYYQFIVIKVLYSEMDDIGFTI